MFQIFLFLSLVYFTNSICSQYFTSVLKNQCENLVINDTHSCFYLNGACITKKSKCESYTGTSDEECSLIRPKNNLNKCSMKDGHCSEVPKVCDDYVSGVDTCKNLKTDDDTLKRCVLSLGKCRAHYKSCESFTDGVTEALCNGNIPEEEDNNHNNKCSWDSANEKCITVPKQCKDYEFRAHDDCTSLTTSDSNKKCFASPTGYGCVEQYKTCELYDEKVQPNDKSKTKCENIRYFSETNFDYTKACYFDDNHCKTKERKCSDNITSEECTLFSRNVLPIINANKICVFSEYQCKEQYKTCELYNDNTDISKRNEKSCKAIIYYDTTKNALDYSYKCIFENQICKKKKKDCNEITDKDLCTSHELDDTNKMCVYDNGQCKEEYKSCSNYNNINNKNEKDCKSIKIYNSDKINIDYTKKCIFNDNSCIQKDLTSCSDYESNLDKKYCTNIYLTNYKKCVFKDNKCVEKYITCPETNEDITEDACESIKPVDESKKCIYEGSNKCTEKIKECSEYKGTDSYDCQKCTSSEADKKCFLENGKCVAKYTECDKYLGNNAEECKKIIPHGTNGIYLGETNKCIMGATNCEITLKECDEVNSYQECNSLSAAKLVLPGNKNCVFKDGKCKEQYKNCETYNNDVEIVDKDICESIVMSNDIGYRCQYIESGGTRSCTKVTKQCSDFKAEDYSLECSSISPSTYVAQQIGLKCLYDNSKCADINKSCSELTSFTSLPTGTDASKICASAPTTYPNRKQCILKNDNSGCEEVEKAIIDEDEDNNAQKNKSNFGLSDKKFIINFIFIIFGLLL